MCGFNRISHQFFIMGSRRYVSTLLRSKGVHNVRPDYTLYLCVLTANRYKIW